MSDETFEYNLMHLILGYGHARYDMGRYEDKDSFAYNKARNEAEQIMIDIKKKYKKLRNKQWRVINVFEKKWLTSLAQNLIFQI